MFWQKFWRLHSWWLVTLGLSLGFIFLRLFKIETSLLFFNDIGRDFLQLWNWQQTGKPPLLGPQTSAMPFNQSAVYFYLLLPGYLLTRGSLLATIYTGVGVHLILLWSGVWWLRQNQPRWLSKFWLIVGLLILQPEMVTQQRFVWNPSFIAGWTMLAL
ncbi:MAG TPA: hypothetical protein DEP87_04655, partial [Candidatus Pacebacteria bacterium]|nr:hypothetical protein [Candidatus Paceibacterota bacterium]